MGDNTMTIATIENFDNVLDVMASLLLDDCLTDEQKEFFSHVLDNECMTIYVINDERIVIADSIGGGVIENMTADEFLKASLEYWKEWGNN